MSPNWQIALARLVCLVVLLGLMPGSVSNVSSMFAGQASAMKAPEQRVFPETGHSVGGSLLDRWTERGGLAQHGFPISEEFDEVSDLDGKSYTVQYFERAVFDMHPEHPAPYDVLLSQLGTFRLKEKYPGGVKGTTPIVVSTPSAGRTPETDNCNPVNEIRKSMVGSTGTVGISRVQYAGQEFVEITNKGGADTETGGWILRDKNDTDQEFRFSEGVVLGAGATIQVYTEPNHQYSFNSRGSIWNNCGDALELVDKSGAVVSTYAYGTHLK